MLSCVLIRHFATTVERHHNPALKDAPLIVATDSRVRRVVAASALPHQRGVEPKMTVKQALLLCPEAQTLTANEGAYQRVAHDLAGELLRFANRVEPEYQPTSTAYYLDTDTETDEIRAFVTRYLNAPVTVGIAANKLTARVAAANGWARKWVVTIPAGEEAAFLARHHVSMLPLSKDMARRLPLLGIDTVGQFAALPQLAVWEQFGKYGKWVHGLASGIDLRAIQPF